MVFAALLSLRSQLMVKTKKEAKAKCPRAKAKDKAAVRLNLLTGTRAQSKAVARQRTSSSASSSVAASEPRNTPPQSLVSDSQEVSTSPEPEEPLLVAIMAIEHCSDDDLQCPGTGPTGPAQEAASSADGKGSGKATLTDAVVPPVRERQASNDDASRGSRAPAAAPPRGKVTLDIRYQLPTCVIPQTVDETPLRRRLVRGPFFLPMAEDVHKMPVFHGWCQEKTLPLTLSPVRRLLDFLDTLFLEGADFHTAAGLVDAQLKSMSDVREWELLEGRLAKALKSWPQVARTSPQLLMPEEAAYAVMGDLMSHNKAHMASSLLLQVILYLRPGETDALEPGGILTPPEGAMTCLDQYGVALSTQAIDTLMLIGTCRNDLLAGQVLERIRAKSSRKSIWNFTSQQLDLEFQRSLAALDLHTYGWTRYNLRYAGITSDLQSQRRTDVQVQDRGRWLTPSTVPAFRRIHPMHQHVDSEIAAYGALVKNNFLQYLKAPKTCPTFQRWKDPTSTVRSGA